MKRKLPLLLVVLLLLSLCSPAARAAAGGLPSRERDDGEIEIDENGLPLVELPAAENTAGVTDAVEGDMVGDSTPMVESPLAVQLDGGSDNSAGTTADYMWFAAAGLVLAAGVAVIVFKRCKKI